MGDNEPVTSPRTVAILGSTGSIGTQALDVISRTPDRFRVVALSAGSQPRPARRQAVTFEVDAVAVARATSRAGRRGDRACRAGRRRASVPEVVGGDERRGRGRAARRRRAQRHHRRRSGCARRWRRWRAGSTLALANKESLIVGGRVGRGSARSARPRSCPVDSEHSAIAQCLRGGTRRRGPAAGRHRVRRPVPRPGREPLARRDPGAGARAPHLGDGPDGHDQLGDDGEQGARGDRGAPAVRHALRPDRRGRAPAVGGPLDGGVRRRLHARPVLPARHAAADRARARLARPRPR